MTDITLGQITYNPARSAFQARVDIARSGRTFRYPAEVSGPLDMDETLLRHSLAQSALAMSDTPDLRLAL